MLYDKSMISNDKMKKSLIKDKEKYINEMKLKKENNNKKGEIRNEVTNTNHDNNTFHLNLERQFMEYQNSVALDSKKQTISNRINDRMMVSQRGCNPFLSQNNYINDLMNQELYIRQNNNLNTP